MRKPTLPCLIAISIFALPIWWTPWATISTTAADVSSTAERTGENSEPKSVLVVRPSVRAQLTDGIFAVDLSPNCQVLAAGTQDAGLQLRDVQSGALKFELGGHEGDVVDVEFDRSGERLASVAFDGIRIWRVATGSFEHLLPAKRGATTWIRFVPNGRTIISGGPVGSIPVQMWDVETGHEFASLPTESGAAKCAAISLDGRLLATVHRDTSNVETINLWDLAGRKLFTSFSVHQGETRVLAFTNDGQHLIVGDQGGELVIWDALSGGCYSTRFPQQKGDITALGLSRDGSLLITSSRSDKSVHLWELSTGRELARLAGHTSVIKGIALSTNGKMAVTGGFDSQIMVWSNLLGNAELADDELLQRERSKQILSGSDALAAQQRIAQLAERPEQGRLIAEETIQPLTETQTASLFQSIQGLSSVEFQRRQQAIIMLKNCGDLAELALRRARKAPVSFTTLQRIDAVLNEVHDQACSSTKRGNIRSIQLLQRIGDEASIGVLKKLARGPDVDLCTTAARGALVSSGGGSVESETSIASRSSIGEQAIEALPSPTMNTPLASTSGSDKDAIELAGLIDQEIETSWPGVQMVAAPPADDYEWIRRVTLDLTGQVPLAYEVEDYVDDPDLAKKEQLIQRLLSSDGHTRHQVQTWRELLLGSPLRDGLYSRAYSFGPAMEQWLTTKFQENLGLDAIVHELLTTPLPDQTNNNYANQIELGSHPTGYFLRQDDLSPSVLGSDCSRMFLGIRLECAQCHDHPFEQWTQDQFWGFAACFSGVRSKTRAVFGLTTFLGEDRQSAAIKIPDTNRLIPARFLDGSTPDSLSNRSTRESLADWTTSATNPYFARTMVNRVWAQFFGQGLAEPLDDLNVGTKHRHDALIDLLAKRFQEMKYDLKFLIRSILLTRAYQRTSRMTHESQKSIEFLAKMPVRSLSGLQLHDSLVRACGFAQFAVIPRDERQYYRFFNSHRLEFVRRAYSDVPKTETEKSMLDALHQMNGEFVDMLAHPRRDETLEVIAKIPGTSQPERIASLYLATLSRRPSPEEITQIESALTRKSETEAEAFTFSDLLWAIFNSAEFNSNH